MLSDLRSSPFYMKNITIKWLNFHIMILPVVKFRKLIEIKLSYHFLNHKLSDKTISIVVLWFHWFTYIKFCYCTWTIFYFISFDNHLFLQLSRGIFADYQLNNETSEISTLLITSTLITIGGKLQLIFLQVENNVDIWYRSQTV